MYIRRIFLIIQKIIQEIFSIFVDANSLWNNLLEPVGAKTKTWYNIFEKFHCPTPERPYLATMLNSQPQNATTEITAAIQMRNIDT